MYIVPVKKFLEVDIFFVFITSSSFLAVKKLHRFLYYLWSACRQSRFVSCMNNMHTNDAKSTHKDIKDAKDGIYKIHIRVDQKEKKTKSKAISKDWILVRESNLYKFVWYTKCDISKQNHHQIA